MDVLEDVVVNCELREEPHIIQAYAKHEAIDSIKPLCSSSNLATSNGTNGSPPCKVKAPDGDKGGGKSKIIDSKVVRNTSFEEHLEKRDHYFHQVEDWSKRLPSSSRGLCEVGVLFLFFLCFIDFVGCCYLVSLELSVVKKNK